MDMITIISVCLIVHQVHMEIMIQEDVLLSVSLMSLSMEPKSTHGLIRLLIFVLKNAQLIGMLIITLNNAHNFVQLVHLHKILQIDVYLCVQQILFHMLIH